MHEQDQRRVAPRRRPEEVEIFARAFAVGQPDLGIGVTGAEGFRACRPARENRRMLGDARAIVVFGLVVDRRLRSTEDI